MNFAFFDDSVDSFAYFTSVQESTQHDTALASPEKRDASSVFDKERALDPTLVPKSTASSVRLDVIAAMVFPTV